MEMYDEINSILESVRFSDRNSSECIVVISRSVAENAWLVGAANKSNYLLGSFNANDRKMLEIFSKLNDIATSFLEAHLDIPDDEGSNPL